MEWLAESATPGVSPHRSTPTNPVRLAVAALYLLLAYAVRAYTQTSGQTDESGRDSSGERAGCVRCVLFHGKIPSFEVRRRIIICLGIKSGREKRRVKSEKALSLSLLFPAGGSNRGVRRSEAGHVLARLVAAATTSEEMYVTRESRYTRWSRCERSIDRWTRELFKRNRLVRHTLRVLLGPRGGEREREEAGNTGRP